MDDTTEDDFEPTDSDKAALATPWRDGFLTEHVYLVKMLETASKIEARQAIATEE